MRDHAWEILIENTFFAGATVYFIAWPHFDRPDPTGQPPAGSVIATAVADAQGTVLVPPPFYKHQSAVSSLRGPMPRRYAAVAPLANGVWGHRMFFAFDHQNPNPPLAIREWIAQAG